MHTNPVSTARYKVLFLRSHCKTFGSAAIASGLRSCGEFDYEQYPVWPESYKKALKKWDHDEDAAWDDLNKNAIFHKRELKKKIETDYYDCVILADHDGWLFTSSQRGAQFYRNFGLLLNLWKKQGGNAARQEYHYRSSLPFSFQELCQKKPVAVVDMTDHPVLTVGNVRLFHECYHYFKRELPYDRFRLFDNRLFASHFRRKLKTAESIATTTSWRDRQKTLVKEMHKLHGIPLGITDDRYNALKTLRSQPQEIDVFWAGSLSNTMRKTAEQRLRSLKKRTSWNLCIQESPLPPQEFYRKIARSKITLSVAGGGWDCMRHYEAIALGSIPLMNRPTVDAVWWHEMPEEMFFENTFVNFEKQIAQLLQSSSLRQRCQDIGEQRVEDHMLWSKIVKNIVTTTMQPGESRTEW